MREQLVKAVSLGHQVDDEVLLQFVTEEGDEPLFLLDEEFFRRYLTGRFPKSAKRLIKKYHYKGSFHTRKVQFF